MPSRTLFTLVFICIFAAWQMGTCDCLKDLFPIRPQQLNLSLMLLGGRIGDLCNGCFVGDFALLGDVRFGVVDPTCVFV